MFKSFLLIVLCCIVFTGCSIHKVQVPLPLLSPSELNTNVAKYNGQTIQMRGYIMLAPEGHVIVESKENQAEFERGIDAGGYFDAKKYNKFCLTIANAEFLFKNEDTINKKTLILRGKFIDNYLGPRDIDLGACPLPTGIIIDEADLRHRYPALLPVK
jgi:hypothetical protein